MAPKRPPLPAIDGDLTKAKRIDLGGIKAPAAAPASAEDVAANARRLGAAVGASTTLPPPPPAPKPLTRWSLELPRYLDDQLARAAIDGDTNKTAIIVRALAAAGFQVDADDMAGGRRRRRS